MPSLRRHPSPLAWLAALLALALPAASAQAHPLKHARWLGGVTVTEYYPVPEAWFVGRKVAAPGLAGTHRIDWLYSARGVSMQGTGIGLDGRLYHIDALGSGGWVTDRGRPSTPGRRGWAGGPPYWRAGGYWLARRHRVTFPLEAGGWANGVGRRYVPLAGVSFAEGPAKPLRYWRSLAVDPRLIPLGSRIYIAAYRHTAGHGWFLAEDVGGAIDGRHVDVYRPPPDAPFAGASMLSAQRIYVIPPGAHAGRGAPGSSGGDGSGSGAGAPGEAGGAGTGGSSAGQAGGAAGGAGAP